MKMDISLTQAVEGYLLDVHARQLSPRTIASYESILARFLAYIGSHTRLSVITANDIRGFLAHLGDRPIAPAGVAPRPSRRLSKKTIRNYHITLSSLWTWAMQEGFVERHVVQIVAAPEPERPAIAPFSRADVEAMLAVCEKSKPYKRAGQRECSNARVMATRDRAIILLLLDTGARASEVCVDPRRGNANELRIQDVDHRNLTVTVWGKGSKERILRISPNTSKAIWRYVISRDEAMASAPLFISQGGRAFTTAGLLQLIKRLGKRAGILNAHPHRFRHTFAVNFLRNGGNALELQYLLGHSTLEMVRRYVKVAQVDLERAHRRASPVANWGL